MEKLINQIYKSVFMKIYHKHGAQTNHGNQKFKWYLGENINNMQLGHVFLKFDMRVKKN